MNRPRRKRELVEVRMMFEPDRFNEHCLKAAYEQIVPIKRWPTRATKEKQRSNHPKAVRLAGGAL